MKSKDRSPRPSAAQDAGERRHISREQWHEADRTLNAYLDMLHGRPASIAVTDADVRRAKRTIADYIAQLERAKARLGTGPARPR